jgi:hypothetical protein
VKWYTAPGKRLRPHPPFLWNGYYQGWDLNPAQFPMRYAAVYAFFLESYDDAVERLKTFVDKAARATLISDVRRRRDRRGLLNYFLRSSIAAQLLRTKFWQRD